MDSRCPSPAAAGSICPGKIGEWRSGDVDDAPLRFTPSADCNPNAAVVANCAIARWSPIWKYRLAGLARDCWRQGSPIQNGQSAADFQAGETPGSVSLRTGQRYEERSQPPLAAFLCPFGSEREGQTDAADVRVAIEAQAVSGLKGVVVVKIKHLNSVSNVQFSNSFLGTCADRQPAWPSHPGRG